MAIRIGRLSQVAFTGGVVVTAPLLAACGGPSFDDWAATDGAAGRINLEDVQEAFKKSGSVTEFEKRVNEIYEGDGIILIRASQDGEKLVLEGWEDLNGSGVVDDTKDDRLFSIVQQNNENTMQGHGANGYYHSSFGAGEFLFAYLLLSSFRGPYMYQTPPGSADTMRNNRNTYRQTSQYKSQVDRNGQFNTRQQQFAGSSYQRSSQNIGSARQTYQQTQKSSGAFRSSSSLSGNSVRSPSGGSGGGATGGGGAPVVRRRRKP